MITRQALPDKAQCYVSGKPANIRCQQCGPFTLCSNCCTTLHNDKQSFHHFPELWKVVNLCNHFHKFILIFLEWIFCPLNFNLPDPSVYPIASDHVCDSGYTYLERYVLWQYHHVNCFFTV